MSEVAQPEKIEFIESYIKGVRGNADYQWNDNHGVLIRCKDCKKRNGLNCPLHRVYYQPKDDWFCADGEKQT